MPVTAVGQDNPTDAGTEADRGCAACAHPWPAHDGIAARFCTATVAGGFSRGCVCSPAPD